MQKYSHEKKMAVTDKRATLQIRISMNKILKNKNSVNTRIAELISSYSHGSLVKTASHFTCDEPVSYYVIKELHSPFWATTVYLPSRLAITQTANNFGTNMGHLYFTPDWGRATGWQKKRIFDPFQKPYIKKRTKRFYLGRNYCRFLD